MKNFLQLRAVGLLCLLSACGASGEETGAETAGMTGPMTGGATDGTVTEGATQVTDGASETAGPSTTNTTSTTASETETGAPTTTEDPTEGMTSSSTGDDTGSGSECDPKAQDCPPGTKCTAYGKLPGDAWNANKCVPEPGRGGAVGDPCAVEGEDAFTGIDNCAAGTICLNTDSEQKNGFCVEFCTLEDTCPETQGGAGLCIVTNDGALPICLFTCDPLLQDCLGSGACYGDPEGPPFICFNPDPKDGGNDGDPCGFTNACLEGLTCADQATQEGCLGDQLGCCTPFCALDEMNCSGAEECVPFFMAEQPGFENVGVCALPG